MKIAIEACIMASFKSCIFNRSSSSLNYGSVDELYNLLLQAFKTDNVGNISDLPNKWHSREPLVCLYPDGDARIYLLKPEEPLDNSIKVEEVPLTVLIVNKSGSPSPERCIESSLRKLEKANSFFGKVRIDLPNEFYLFPISNGEIDDSEHHFIASRREQTSPFVELKSTSPFIILLLLCHILINSFVDIAQVVTFFRDALIGVLFTKVIDSLVNLNKNKFKAYVDLDRVMQKEEEHLMNCPTRTNEFLNLFGGQTDLLKRSDNKDGVTK